MAKYGLKKELVGKLSSLKVGLDRIFGATRLKNLSQALNALTNTGVKVDDFIIELYAHTYDDILSESERSILRVNLGEVVLFLLPIYCQAKFR